ncbi:hypothetical protein DFJ58DRAFT_348365 [Suillus subalutaceus]|uniref:uncharacterized protein n=1 Tax=Suillus subalutaceus TaxID=48586 RepID=UPI001B85EB32|nr:uncharacterized protein DFJ58DRAFT_348365 [Suillus subalutaceus]KAG1827739.1 hypothetical protein DFJ58DRAFT_348365 [Suillus subalutaceus]
MTTKSTYATLRPRSLLRPVYTILANIHFMRAHIPLQTIARKNLNSAFSDLLNSDATRRPAAGCCRPPIPAIPMVQRPSLTIEQPMFLRLSKLLRFSRANALRPGQKDQPCDPLDISATLPLPRPLSVHTSTLRRSDINSGGNASFDRFPSHSFQSRLLSTTTSSATGNPPTTFAARIHHLSFWRPIRGGHGQPSVVDIPLAQARERHVAADAPKKDDDIVPIEYLDPPSPNPDSQQPATAAQPATGEHGGDRSCFCF